jgi:SagB-type dehydrogenase family enzyme
VVPTDVSRRAFLAGVAALAAVPAVGGCRDDRREERGVTTPTGTSTAPAFALPPPTTSGLPLGVALERRRSVREYAPDRLSEAEVAQLLWAAQGITADWGGRTAPSAGGLYPLEVYAVTPEQVLHYLPDGHRAEIAIEGDRRASLMGASLDQDPVARAPLVVLIAGVPARTAARYGDRAARYVDLEVGHAAQNVLLQAVALELVAVPIGAFDDEAVADVLALPDGHEPRYLLPVGRPRA